MNAIRIVLVRTHAAGNIGAASRAMKNMGLRQLVLVNPRDFPSEEASRMATRGAADILEGAQVVDSLYNAVKDCQLVIACTARPRSFDLPVVSPEQAAQRLLYATASTTNITTSSITDTNTNTTKEEATATTPSVALVFGPETAGLSNDDIRLAHYRVTIPANPENSSLNLASAVQILSYELGKLQYGGDSSYYLKNDDVVRRQEEGTDASTSSSSNKTTSEMEHQHSPTPKHHHQQQQQLPTIAQREHFYDALEKVLQETGVAHKEDPRNLMLKLRRILDRAEPDASELNLLQGALAMIQRRLLLLLLSSSS